MEKDKKPVSAQQVLPKTAGKTVTYAAQKKNIDKEPGKIIGKYPTIRSIGGGGMGLVYLAEHPTLKRKVVIKELKLKNLASHARDRFKREAEILMELTSPYIVRMYDYFDVENIVSGRKKRSDYIVLEYVDGMSLDQLLKKQYALPAPLAMLIFLDVCYGLKSAHGRNIIHRDIKPGNILISKRAEVKLADFGISGSEKDGENDSESKADSSAAATVIDEKKAAVTLAGQILGTPAYMSPEQIEDSSTVDKRTDIYSMGVMLYQMLTGDRPFSGELNEETKAAIKRGKYISPRKLDKSIPLSIEHLIKKMMAANKERRYQNIDIVIKKVKRYMAKYDKDTRHNIRVFLARSVANDKVIAYPVWGERFKRIKIVAAVASVLAVLAYFFYSGLVYRTVLSPWFSPLSLEMELPANSGAYSAALPAKAFFFENRDDVPEVKGMNGSRVFFEDKKASIEDGVINLATKDVFLRPGDYRVKVVEGPYVWWKSFSVVKGKKERVQLDFLKGEKRTLSIHMYAEDYDTKQDITNQTSFQMLVNGTWTALSKVKNSSLSTGQVIHLRAVADGYEVETFGLSIDWYQDSLFVNASLKKITDDGKNAE